MLTRSVTRFALAAVLVAGLLSAAPSAAATELDEQAALAGLQAWLDQTQDLRGEFRQTLVSGALGSGLEESGKLFVARPGRMRWEYLEPERKLALIVGERTWLYLEDDEQLMRGRLEAESRLLPALLAGEGRLAELFRPELTATPKHGGAGAYRLRLVPLEESESFHQVVITLRPPDFGIEAAEVLDPAGNRMRYDFRDLRRNKGLADSLFHFEPPPGTLISGEP